MTGSMTTAVRLGLLSLLLISGCVTDSSTYTKEVNKADVVRAQYELGATYLGRGSYRRAKDYLSKVLELDPKFALAHVAFGLIFEHEEEYVLANEHFQKAIKFDPALTEARVAYAGFLDAQGRYPEAIDQLLVAADNRFYQSRPTVYENLGRSYLRIDDVNNAIAAFERAIALNNNQPRALLELAELKLGQQGYVEAFALYRRHIGVSDQSARSLWLCIQLAERFSNPDEKASCALTLKNIFPATPQYRFYEKRFGQ
jgi:type IV pilus assembly protein PilF